MNDAPTPPESETSPRARRALGAAFFTLFLDLIGFSIIFPLFPTMLDFYRETETVGLFPYLYGILEQFSSFAGGDDAPWRIVVLFGGLLGSVYSVLQFIFTPILGALSDRVGRNRSSIFPGRGTDLLYPLVLRGEFLALVLARLVGVFAAQHCDGDRHR